MAKPPQPGRASRLAKVATPSAKEILERYEPSDQAAALATDGTPPDRFLDRLIAEELVEDALSFLAYALPRREALWWGLRCVREITPPEPPPEIGAALASVDAWVGKPSDELRRAAMKAAEAATYATPAGCLALAVFFSEGSMAPADCPPVPVGEWFCARTIAATVLLGSLANGPDKARKTAQGFADVGIEVANQPAPWEKPA